MKKNATQETDRATKGLRFAVKDADAGTVTAVFSRFNVRDEDGDVTLPGAFKNGQRVLISAYGHASWGGALPVGTGVIYADDEKAWMDGQFFLDTIGGKETFTTIKGTGELQEWSYGYDVLERGDVTDAMRQAGVWRVLKSLDVFEVSPVLLGAGVGTGTLSVKGAKDQVEPIETPAVAETPPPASSAEALREFARFQKTRARLALSGRAAA